MQRKTMGFRKGENGGRNSTDILGCAANQSDCSRVVECHMIPHNNEGRGVSCPFLHRWHKTIMQVIQKINVPLCIVGANEWFV